MTNEPDGQRSSPARPSIRRWRSGSRALLLGSVALLTALDLAPATVAAEPFSVRVYDSVDRDPLRARDMVVYAASRALVVHVERYDHGWQRHERAALDAAVVAGALATAGFAVERLADPTREELVTKLGRFLIDAESNSEARLVVWFSGLTHTDVRGTSYLLPRDAPPRESERAQLQAGTLSIDELTSKLRGASGRHILVVIDGEARAGDLRPVLEPQRAVTQATLERTRAVLISNSTGTADDVTLFRNRFVEAINGDASLDANHDGLLTTSEVGPEIAAEISRQTSQRQRPVFARLDGRDFPDGDMILARIVPVEREPVLSAAAEQGGPVSPREELAAQIWDFLQRQGNEEQIDAFLTDYGDTAQGPKARQRRELLQAKVTERARRECFALLPDSLLEPVGHRTILQLDNLLDLHILALEALASIDKGIAALVPPAAREDCTAASARDPGNEADRLKLAFATSDTARRRELLEASPGSSLAQLYLGLTELADRQEAKPSIEVYERVREAARSGLAAAQLWLGLLELTRGDRDRALALLRDAAGQGLAMAMGVLAVVLGSDDEASEPLLGKGLPIDLPNAMFYAQQAEAQGFVISRSVLDLGAKREEVRAEALARCHKAMAVDPQQLVDTRRYWRSGIPDLGGGPGPLLQAQLAGVDLAGWRSACADAGAYVDLPAPLALNLGILALLDGDEPRARSMLELAGKGIALGDLLLGLAEAGALGAIDELAARPQALAPLERAAKRDLVEAQTLVGYLGMAHGVPVSAVDGRAMLERAARRNFAPAQIALAAALAASARPATEDGLIAVIWLDRARANRLRVPAELELKIRVAGRESLLAVLGLTLADLRPEVRKEFRIADGMPGVVVREVARGSAAARGDLQRGDLIMRVEDGQVANVDQAAAALLLGLLGTRRQADLTVQRNGDTQLPVIKVPSTLAYQLDALPPLTR